MNKINTLKINSTKNIKRKINENNLFNQKTANN